MKRNLAVIAHSPNSLYASVMISKLIQQGDRPVCVISKKGDRFVTLRKILGDIKYSLVGGKRKYLENYARKNGLRDWNRTLNAQCLKYGTPFFAVDRINDPGVRDTIKRFDVDVIVYAGGGGILKKTILDAPRVGVIMPHEGMLPAYRGRDCMEWAILNGDPAGISLILLDEGIDTGDIISVKDMPMSEVRTLEDLHAKAEVLKIEMITECINTGTFTGKKQRKDEGRNYRAMDSETKNKLMEKIS